MQMVLYFKKAKFPKSKTDTHHSGVDVGDRWVQDLRNKVNGIVSLIRWSRINCQLHLRALGRPSSTVSPERQTLVGLCNHSREGLLAKKAVASPVACVAWYPTQSWASKNSRLPAFSGGPQEELVSLFSTVLEFGESKLSRSQQIGPESSPFFTLYPNLSSPKRNEAQRKLAILFFIGKLLKDIEENNIQMVDGAERFQCCVSAIIPSDWVTGATLSFISVIPKQSIALPSCPKKTVLPR